MNLHSGARSCLASRVLLVQRIAAQGWPVPQAAAAAGLSRRSAFKWLRRYREQGPAGLVDRSSRPQRMPRATPAASMWVTGIVVNVSGRPPDCGKSFAAPMPPSIPGS